MKRGKAYPPLPSKAFSALGSLPVGSEKLEGALGQTRFTKRTISILPDMDPATAWQTYWHECAHVMIWDAGLQTQIEAKTIESLCDAIGTYLAAAVRSGFLKVNDNDD